MKSPHNIDWHHTARGNLLKQIAVLIDVDGAKGSYDLLSEMYYITYKAAPLFKAGAYWFEFDEHQIPYQVEPDKRIRDPNVIITPNTITIFF